MDATTIDYFPVICLSTLVFCLEMIEFYLTGFA